MKGMLLKKSQLTIGAIDFNYKKEIIGTIAKFKNEVNIQFIQSRYPNKGNCQKFIKAFKKDLESRGYKLVSSTPISRSWRHICKKLNIKYYN